MGRMARNRNRQIHDTVVQVEQLSIPVRIITERRNSWRVALSSQSVIARVPHKSEKQIQQIILPWVEQWLNKIHRKNHQTLSRFSVGGYSSDHLWRTIFGDYGLRFDEITTPKIRHGLVHVPHNWADCRTIADAHDRQKSISKEFIGLFLPNVQEMVDQINQETVHVPIRKISMRHNSSRWGSCSTTGNITLNSRLLLSDLYIIRSVIIHELAHRIHPNHSRSFWNEVAKYDPNYRKTNRWLKENGQVLQF